MTQNLKISRKRKNSLQFLFLELGKTTVKAMGNIIAETSQIKGVSKLSPFIGIAIGAATPPTVGGGGAAKTKSPKVPPPSVSA